MVLQGSDRCDQEVYVRTQEHDADSLLGTINAMLTREGYRTQRSPLTDIVEKQDPETGESTDCMPVKYDLVRARTENGTAAEFCAESGEVDGFAARYDTAEFSDDLLYDIAEVAADKKYIILGF